VGNKKNCFYIFEILVKCATAVSIVAIPVVIAYYSSKLAETINNREIKLKYVKLSIEILSNPPRNSTLKESERGKNDPDAIREWAINIIDELAPIKMTKSTKDELQKKRLVNIPKPACSLSIQKDEKRVIVSWTATDATSAAISGIGPVSPLAGSRTIDIDNAENVYTLIVIGPGGTSVCRRSITDQ